MSLSLIAWRTAPLLWGLAAAGVWVWTTHYQFTTVATGERALIEGWPEDTPLELADDRPTLLVFLHPHCPCTRASLHELERTLTGSGFSESQHPKVLLIVSSRRDARSDWLETDTVQRALALPLAEVFWDFSGSECSRFGATTSGDVRLFSPTGKQLFAGGVTASRGHEGANTGADRLYALLSQQTDCSQASTPVFGCRLIVEANAADCSQDCHLQHPAKSFIPVGAVE